MFFNPKNLLIVCIIGFLAMIYFWPKQDIGQAQEGSGRSVICAEPIPIGNAYSLTLNIIDDLYKQYGHGDKLLAAGSEIPGGGIGLIGEIDRAIATGNEVVKRVNGMGEQVCDFSKCQASTSFNMAANIALQGCLSVNPPIGCKNMVDMPVPACKPLKCDGDPCPLLKDPLEDLKTTDQNVAAINEFVNKIFIDPSVIVSEDLRMKNEKAGEAKITRLEEAKRMLALANAWYRPWGGSGAKTCAMNATERRMAQDGLVPLRSPQKCMEQLKNGNYWPRAWSYACQRQCSFTPFALPKECVECLKDGPSSKEESWLAKFNYRFFALCEKKCQKYKLDVECADCLLGDPKDLANATDDEKTARFLEFVCGGDTLNQVCCEERPYTSEGLSNSVFYLPQMSEQMSMAEVFQLAKDSIEIIKNETGKDIRPAFFLAILAKESALGRNTGDCLCCGSDMVCSDKADESKCENKTKNITDKSYADITNQSQGQWKAMYDILTSLGRNVETHSESVPVSCPATDQKGGAMGPCQIMPETWNSLSAKLTEILGGRVGDPWDARDAFLTSLLFLANNNADTNEQGAAEAYMGIGTNAGKRYANEVLCESRSPGDITADIEKYKKDQLTPLCAKAYQKLIDEGILK